jgi:hypothetical protein
LFFDEDEGHMADVGMHDYGTTGTTADRSTGWPGALSRVNWGAVFAGLVIATALQVVLTVLGAAIGLTALEGEDSGRAFGIGTGLWALLIPVVTLFIGGMIAGRLATVRDRAGGFIHGALVWGLSLLLATYLLGSGASRVLGGVLDLAGNLTGGAVAAAGSVASRSDVDANAVEQARARAEAEARDRGVTEQDVRAKTAQVRESAGEVADKAQAVAAGGAWLALLALGLSLAAAAFGAIRAVPRAARS